MPVIDKQKAKKLCRKDEFKIIEPSFELSSGKVSEQVVKKKIVLTRKLRDKYRSIARREVRSDKGKALNYIINKSKYRLFSQVLDAYKNYMEKIRKRASLERILGRKTKKSKKSGMKSKKIKSKAAKKNEMLLKSQAPDFKQHSLRQKRSGYVAIRGHTKSQTARNQAKRDRRGKRK